ncbi:Methylphosphotriester-DNA-protein-cysteine S-methyltransferase [Hartmannibacter diazotrophicus]|uniref:Methylphosphotriester-DNA-protein-cysteine S-methyltransferase n=1 Tax=Hartmannibacter diazotrophicus TaxID=1482074 RepID=A0A2C9D2H3_9HYPH|nr:Methylphosphotriester-DNA-protein-cysteine S-methyltransferase [Hartmannibacter diazotrophicus]
MEQPAIVQTILSVSASDIMITRTHGAGPESASERALPRADAYGVTVQLRSLDDHKLWNNGRLVGKGPCKRGALAIADLRQKWDVCHLSPYDEVQFKIPFARLEAFAKDAGRPEYVGLACHTDVLDGVMLGLARALLPALEAPETANMLFVEQINLAMLTHLTQSYGGLHFSSQSRGTLARWQEKRATDILVAHLDKPVSISTLADACDLSRSYFIKAFKESFGRTPHRWLTEYRVARAKALLRQDIPLAEIALICGFSDQSHFSRVFTAIAGETPGRFRQLYGMDESADWPGSGPEEHLCR